MYKGGTREKERDRVGEERGGRYRAGAKASAGASRRRRILQNLPWTRHFHRHIHAPPNTRLESPRRKYRLSITQPPRHLASWRFGADDQGVRCRRSKLRTDAARGRAVRYTARTFRFNARSRRGVCDTAAFVSISTSRDGSRRGGAQVRRQQRRWWRWI